MRRAGLALLFVLGFGAAGGLSAGVVAATTSGTTTGTTTTAPRTIAPGVSIGGIDVGDLTADEAIAEVNAAFAEPFRLHGQAAPWRRGHPLSNRARWNRDQAAGLAQPGSNLELS